MSVATESNCTVLALFFITVKEIADIASDRPIKNLCGFIENVPHDVRSVRFTRYKASAWEQISIYSTSKNAIGNFTTH